MRGRKVAIFGVFTALSLIFSYVELLIPINFGIPGAKLGLANLMTVLVLYKMGIKEALTLSVTRIILSGFMFGNLFGILYSLPIFITLKGSCFLYTSSVFSEVILSILRIFGG